MRRIHNGLASLLMAWWLTLPVHAQDVPRATLITYEQPDAALTEVAARLRGELTAADFQVAERTSAPTDEPRGTVAQQIAAGETAVILIRRSATGELECWVADRILGPIAHAHLEVSPDVQAPRALALRVVDLLHGRMAERALHNDSAASDGARRPALPIPAVAVVAATRVASDTRDAWSLAAGAMGYARARGWGFGVLPAIALHWRRERAAGAQWGARCVVAGFGNAIQRSTAMGRLAARQGLGLMEGTLEFATRTRVTPLLALGVGGYGVGVRGDAHAPYHAHQGVRITPAMSLRSGIDVRVARRVSIGVAALTFYSPSETKLRIAAREVAHTGGVLFGGSMEVRVWL